MGNNPLRGCCDRLKSIFNSSSETENHSKPQKLITLDKIDKISLNQEKTIYSSKNYLNFSYQYGEIIGSGPHGNVFESLCLENGEIVAIKKISCLPEFRKKIYLYLECKLMNLNHENLLKYIDIYQNNDNSFELNIVSRLISGCSLKEALNTFEKFEEKIVRIFCKEILQGLIYLSQQGIYHSNLKPNNILIEADGHIKISDFFTISKKLLSPERKNYGTNFTYKSPEIIIKQKKGIKADIWALGCIAIEMLTNKEVWSNDLKFITEKLKRKTGPDIPENLSSECFDFLSKCLEIDEEERLGPENLILHQFIQKEKEYEEKDKIFLRGLSVVGSPLKKKSKFPKKNLENNNEKINGEEVKDMKVLGEKVMEKSVIYTREQNELERKKYEAELLEMFNDIE